MLVASVVNQMLVVQNGPSGSLNFHNRVICDFLLLINVERLPIGV